MKLSNMLLQKIYDKVNTLGTYITDGNAKEAEEKKREDIRNTMHLYEKALEIEERFIALEEKVEATK